VKVNIAMLKECLRDLSDEEFQKRVWLLGAGPEESSFSELISQTFDDTGLSDVLDSPNFVNEVGGVAVQRLHELDKEISDLDQTLSPSQLIMHPKMKLVRELALKALEALDDLPSKD